MVGSGYLLVDHFAGRTLVGPPVTQHEIPPNVLPAGSSSTSSPTENDSGAPSPAGGNTVGLTPEAPHSTATQPEVPGTPPPRATRSETPVGVVADQPGRPVRIRVPSHHVDATVVAHEVLASGGVYVPRDPHVVSWASGANGVAYSAPGSAQGTAILVAHINYSGVRGAFWDLASYQVGQRVTVVLADGREMRYRVAAAPISIEKSRLDADLNIPGEPLHHKIFDQTHSYGMPGQPRSGRLLLASCGGSFDNATGNYESNILVFALPETTADGASVAIDAAMADSGESRD